MTLPTNPGHTYQPNGRWITRRIFLAFVLLVIAVIAAGICWQSVFVVDETQTALLLSFGRPVNETLVEAGLHLKRPWQTVHKFDCRVQLLVLEPRQLLTSDHEPVVVQPYACWRIAPERTNRYLQSALNRSSAEAFLADVIWSNLDREFAKRTLTGWFNPFGKDTSSGLPVQTQIMEGITRLCQQKALQQFGIELLDVRLYRLSRPEWMKEGIYRRMIADRQHIADKMRQNCAEQVKQMKSAARQEADELIYQAKARAQTIRMQTQTQSQRLLSDARQLEPELMALAEKLENYRSLLNNNATLVLSGDPDIFGTPTSPQTELQQPPSSQPASSP